MTGLSAAFGLAGAMALGAIASVAVSEPPRRRETAAFFLAWFVPGAGHLLLGRRVKAAVFFVLLAATYVTGLWLCGWRHVAFEDNPFYYVGQFGSGVTTFLGQILSEPKGFPPENRPPSWFGPGMLYLCVTGLLNLVIMMNVPGAARSAAGPVTGEAPR